MSSEYILQVKGVSKAFPGVKALDKVDFEVRPGEVVALVGENGAGKSTLMKTLIGVHQRDEGEVYLDGEPVNFHDPLKAKNAGITMIFQELSLVNTLTVMENIFVGNLPMKGKFVNWKEMAQRTKVALDQLGCKFSPRDLVGNLSISQQQMVELARALVFDAKVVFFDEPTSSITQHEKNLLFQNIRHLQSEGVGIVYVSHKMDEVFELSDQIIVFRDGKRIGKLKTAETDLTAVTEMMIGRSIDNYFRRNQATPGDEILRVESITQKGVFEDISFSVKKGEVLGFYGLVGAGRTEVIEAVFGVRHVSSGHIYFKGKEITNHSSKSSIKIGIGLVPEDRKLQGCILGMSAKHNCSLAQLGKLQKGGFIKSKEELTLYQYYKDRFSIKCPTPNQQVGNLSGGNQQKIIVAKWLATKPDLLILDEPTRGIDVGAKSEIHNLIAELAEAGLAVIVISSEMPEVIGVSNRIIVMHEGRIVDELSAQQGIEERDLIRNIAI